MDTENKQLDAELQPEEAAAPAEEESGEEEDT